jgi:energy-coupling factor transporter transmembrane protein EcfT
MRDPKKPWIFNIDPGTLLLIVAALLLVPLLLAGFFSQ